MVGQHGGPPNYTRFKFARVAPRTSTLAVLSLLAGMVSVPLMCMCFLSIPFSLSAIILGHVSRGVIRDTHGTYSGMEMGTFGMLLGYATLTFTVVSATVWFGAHHHVQVPASPDPVAASPLLRQAELQLLSSSEDRVFGVTTSSHSATALAAHYVEAMNLLESVQGEHGELSGGSPAAYRVFVQLNESSAAFLLYVPGNQGAATEDLRASAWLIAQRSVDGILPPGRQLAVALYSEVGCEVLLAGETTRDNDAAPQVIETDRDGRLSAFFQVSSQGRLPPDQSGEELIPASELPAERE